MSNSAIQSMRSIDRFLREVAATEKRAAEAHTEPGSVGGATTHPVKNVDDSTEEATEGSRSQENTEDVKADEGPASVDSTPQNVAAKKANVRKKYALDGKSEGGGVNPPGTATSDQLQIGTRKAPTGEDPSVETASTKAEKEDSTGGRLGATTHPARTNNSELDGYKYAEMAIEKLASHTASLGNELLAKLAELTAEPTAYRSARASEKEAVDLAGQAGWDLAGLVSGNFDKQAADALVFETVEQIIKTANDDADKVGHFMHSFYAQQHELAKQAEGEMPQGIDPAMLGGAEAAGAGELPEEAMEGGEGGEELEGAEDAQAQLAQLATQLGISPEDLIAAIAAEADGSGEEEAAPEEETADAAPGMEVEAAFKLAADILAAEREKQEKEAAAKKGAASQSMRDYMQEVLAKSRR